MKNIYDKEKREKISGLGVFHENFFHVIFYK